MKKTIEIFTDGSNVVNEFKLAGNGWAYVIPELSISESGKVYEESNIARMELTAILNALKYVANNKNDYIIYNDNLPTVKCFKGEGSRKIYKDLWSEVYVLVNQARKIGSTVRVEFLNRKGLDPDGDTFKRSQEVDKLAYVQANSLDIIY